MADSQHVRQNAPPLPGRITPVIHDVLIPVPVIRNSQDRSAFLAFNGLSPAELDVPVYPLLRTMLDNRIPFYSHENVVSVARMVEQVEARWKDGTLPSDFHLEMEDLDGSVAKYPIRLGDTTTDLVTGAHVAIPDGAEQYWDGLAVDFQCMDIYAMVVWRVDGWLLNPRAMDMYPMTVHHRRGLRDKTTGEPVPWPVPDNAATEREIEVKWAETVKQWLDPESPSFKLLERELAPVRAKRAVKKIIGFGFGSLTFTWNGTGTYEQHGLLLALQAIFPDAAILLQDPAYAPIDRRIFGEGHGMRFVNGYIGGFVELDNESVALSFWPDIPVKAIIADLARPSVVITNIGTEISKDFKYNRRPTDPDTLSYTRMMEGYAGGKPQGAELDGWHFGDSVGLWVRSDLV